MDFEAINNELFQEKPKQNETIVNVINIEGASKLLCGLVDLKPLENQASSLEVIDASSQSQAVSMAAQTRKIKNVIDKARKEIVQPHVDFQRAVNQLAKSFDTALEAIENGLKKKILAYDQEQRILQQEKEKERLKLEEQAKNSLESSTHYIPENPSIVAPIVIHDQVRTEDGTMKIQKKTIFELVDISKVPSEYLMINEKAIKESLKMGIRSIPGLKIDEIDDVSLRANSL